jgi:hypothetical protein
MIYAEHETVDPSDADQELEFVEEEEAAEEDNDVFHVDWAGFI